MLFSENIGQLEKIKDNIVKFYESTDSFDNAWITDAKEVYYNILSAWTLIRRHEELTKEKKRKQANSAKLYLENAKSRKSQVISELKVYKEKEVLKLISSLEEIFNLCYDEINELIDTILPKREIKPPKKQIFKVSEEEYHLLCSICGEIAAIFAIIKLKSTNKRTLVYSGIVHNTALDISDAKKIFGLLENNDLSTLHSMIKSYVVLEEGIDAYCPECDKIYCRNHYKIREEWDEGFYDCTYATCPKNHKRIIDD
jgi:hypothetical protein